MIFLLCERPGTGGMDAGSCWKSPSVDGARKDVCAGAQAQTHVRTYPCTLGVPGVRDPGLHHPWRAPRALPAPCPVWLQGVAYLLRGTSPRLQLLCPLLGPHCPSISLTGRGALYGPGPLPFPLSVSTGFWYFQSWVSAWPLTQRAFLAVTPLAEVVTRMK